MRYTASLLLASLVVALIAACGGGGGGGDIPANAVATVDGDPVLRRDVDTLLNQACRSHKQQKRPCPKAGTPKYLQLQNPAVQILVYRIQ